ncbi:uncharacterized protein LOC126823281 [Patella vulgata]|uniref:uncharacterized protein LOC126823281 n=1 Tax=Patella vulgata TaxID=6465 RepID=UPI0024A9F236|nr:uncharacterized protein LOC126823281 [Patella vulgata]
MKNTGIKLKNIKKIGTESKNKYRDSILKVFQARLQSPNGGGAILVNIDKNLMPTNCFETQKAGSKLTKQDVKCITKSRKSGSEIISKQSQKKSHITSHEKKALELEKTVKKKQSICVGNCDQHVAITTDKSSDLSMDSPENNRPKRKKRKTRAQRNKLKPNNPSKKCENNQKTSTVTKHLSSTQNLSNMVNTTVYDSDLAFSRITNTRLTKRLGLFNQGKKSMKIGRDPIVVSNSIRKKTDADLWKIIHNADDDCNQMDVDYDIHSPNPINDQLSTSRDHLSTVEQVLPNPVYITPLSNSLPNRHHSSATSTGVSSGTANFTGETMPNSPPLQEISNFLMKSLLSKKMSNKNDLLQTTCDELKKMIKQKIPPSATPMSCRISTSSSSHNTNSIQRSLLNSFIQEKTGKDREQSKIIKTPILIELPKTNGDVIKIAKAQMETDVPMLSRTQSPVSSKDTAFANAKSLLQMNDDMAFSQVNRVTNSHEIGLDLMDDGSNSHEEPVKAMSTSQSLGFHNVHTNPPILLPTVDHYLQDDRSVINIHDHRQNLLTALHRASRPPLRTTEAVITELQPQYMPHFHGDFYKDPLITSESIWPCSYINPEKQQAQTRGCDILDILDSDRQYRHHLHSIPSVYIPETNITSPSWHFTSMPPPSISSSPPKLFPRRLY